MQNFTVNDDNNGARLDRWVKRFLPDVPHSMLNRMLRKGEMRINGKKVEANHRLKTGDLIVVKGGLLGEWELNAAGAGKKKSSRPRNEKEEVKEDPEVLIAEFNKLIIFENSDYVIINKPPGLASQGGTGIKISVDDMIGAISERYKLIHRLDKDTSGVLAIAKKTTAAATFSRLLQNKKDISKIYWALVRGLPPKQKGIIKLSLAKRGERMEKVEVDEADGKKSVTEYTLLEKMGKDLSWLELSPITGRTHQLRVHCAAIGCPIIGDRKYGGPDAFEKGLSDKLHLHARRLIVPELEIDVTAKLPAHMKAIEPNV